jgi:hypothetical protein
MAVRQARFQYSMKDSVGGRSSLVFHAHVDDTLTIANAFTALATVQTLFENVSDGGVKDGEFSLLNTGIATSPGSDSDCSSGATFDFLNGSDTTIYGLYIPSFKDTLISSDGHIQIDTGPSSDFVAGMIGAILGGVFTNTRYVPLTEGTRAFRSKRKLAGVPR